MVCRDKLDWNDILNEECWKEQRLISNDAKQVEILKLVVGMVILKVLLKLSCMVSPTLVYQVTIAADIYPILLQYF